MKQCLQLQSATAILTSIFPKIQKAFKPMEATFFWSCSLMSCMFCMFRISIAMFIVALVASKKINKQENSK
jgi:hypothetical protein